MSSIIIISFQTVANESRSPEDLLERVVWVWSDKLPLVSPEERRKLCALGLAHLCGSGWPPVMKVWPAAVSAVVEVVYDVTLEDSTQDKLVRIGTETKSVGIKFSLLANSNASSA